MRAKEFTIETALGTNPKRPARPGSRPDRGHKSEPRYKEQDVAEMDSQGYRGVRDDDYDYNKGKWHKGKIMTAKDAAEHARTELDNIFNSPEQLKKDADYRAYRKGVKASRKEKPTPLPTKDVEESATAPIIVPKRRANAKPEPKFDIPYSADDYVPPALSMASAEALDRIIADPSTKETTRELAKKARAQKKKGVAEGTGPQSKLDQKIIHLLTNGIPADAIARKLDIPIAWVDEVAEYNMPDSAIDYNDPRNTPPTNRFGEGVAEEITRMEAELAEHGKASRELCKSSKPDSELGASMLSSCKSQGLRARDGEKSHKLGKSPKSRVKVGGHKIKGRKYGGPLPDWS